MVSRLNGHQHTLPDGTKTNSRLWVSRYFMTNDALLTVCVTDFSL